MVVSSTVRLDGGLDDVLASLNTLLQSSAVSVAEPAFLTPRSGPGAGYGDLPTTAADETANIMGRDAGGASGSHPIEWRYIAVGAGIAAVLWMVLICMCISCICYCCKNRRRRKGKGRDGGAYDLLMEEIPAPSSAEVKRRKEMEKREKENKKRRDKERKRQEEQEIDVSQRVMWEFSEDRPQHYSITERLPDLGSRLQKHWFKGYYRDSSGVIATEAPRTKHCRLALTTPTFDIINNSLLPSIGQHPFILPIHEVFYNSEEDKMLTVQPLITRGSLRDYIFQERNPLLDWSKKYIEAHGLPMSKISLFGRQVLAAISFLYKQGFPSLGHIHSGNILMVSDSHCKLGGYENMLLGYRTRLYQQCSKEGYLKSIDVVMFGHVMYEMGYGRELGEVLPQEQDYRCPVMLEEQREHIEEIVAYVFDKKSQTSFKQIMNHKFFTGSALEATPEIDISKRAKRLLDDIGRGISRSLEGTASTMGPESLEARKMEAYDRVEVFVGTSPYNSESLKQLPDIGRRVGKYWFKARTSGKEGPATTQILSICTLPESSPVPFNSATQRTLNTFFDEIQHPLLHQTSDIHFLEAEVLISQRMVEKGSLRDRILATNPYANWTKKLDTKPTPLTGKVSLYGRQILEALEFLYLQGFPPLGHLHTGNLFLETGGGGREVCKLGGHVNTLLRYKTSHRFYSHQKYSESVDLRMFGHVIYEMSAGRELLQAQPVESDYDFVKGNKDGVRSVLSFIFSTSDRIDSGETSYKQGLEQVKSHTFFITSSQMQVDSEFNTSEVVVSDDMRQLLEKIRKSVLKKRKRKDAKKP